MKCLFLFWWLLAVFFAQAQDGTLDGGFGTNGVAKTVFYGSGATTNTPGDLTKIVVQKDGKIVQVGYKDRNNFDEFVVIRYLENGQLDGSFGVEGGWFADDISAGSDRAHSVAVQEDKKIIVAGETTKGSKTVFTVVRYDEFGKRGIGTDNFGINGVAATDLTPNNSFSSVANTVAIQPDGKIVVAGKAMQNSTNKNDFAIVRYQTDGTLDPSFGNQGVVFTDINLGDDEITDLKILKDGRILVGGVGTQNGISVFAMAMYTSGGALDAANFGTNGIVTSSFTGKGRSLAVFNDQLIYFTGLSNSAGGYDFTTISYDIKGNINASFGKTAPGITIDNLGSAEDYSRSIIVQCDGKIIVGGDYKPSSNPTYAVVRYLPNGNPDPSFGNNGRFFYNTSSSNGSNWDQGYSGLAFHNNRILMGGISFVPPTNFFTGRRTYFHATVVGIKNAPPQPQVKIIDPPPSCSPVDLTAAGITFGSDAGLTYTYWKDAAATIEQPNPQAITTSGTYYIKGAATPGCFAVKPVSVVITSAPQGAITPATASFCSGGSQLLTTSGGTSYQWYKEGNPISGATQATYTANQAGVYSVVIINGSCSGPASNTATITVISAPTGSITPSSASICPAGSQVLTASGGTTYQWYLNGVMIPNVSSNTYQATQTGTYSVVISDGNCSGPASNTVTITSAAAPTGSIVPQNPSLCPGTSVQLIAPANYVRYAWYKDGNALTETSPQLLVNGAGTYKVEFTNAAGCTGSATTTVTNAASPTLLITNPSPSCTAVDITAPAVTSGSDAGLAYTYWTDNAATTALSNPQAVSVTGTYYIKGTTTGGCFSIKPVTVTLNNLPSGAITPATASICANGSQLLTVTGGTSYQWYLNNVAITNATQATYNAMQAGTYSAVIINGACSAPASNTATVSVVSPPQGSISPASATICPGDAQLLTVTGGSSYQWFRNGVAINGATSATYSATQAGTYSVVITNGMCSGPASNTATINVGASPTVSITPAGPVFLCTGTSVQLTATSGGNAYQWYKEGNLIANANQAAYTVSAAGNYSVEMTKNNCKAVSNPVTVNDAPVPFGKINPPVATICSGGSQMMTINGGLSYQWFFNGNAISGATEAIYTAKQAGTYSVLIINDHCSAMADNTSVISVMNTPTGNITPAEASICPGGEQTLTATGGTSYQWYKDGNTISGATSSTFIATAAGTYSVVIINVTCSGPAANTATITVSNTPTGAITPQSPSICAGTSVVLSGPANYATYQWYKEGVVIAGANQVSYTAVQGGNYSVEFTTASGCKGMAATTVSVSAAPTGTITPTTASFCAGGSADLTANGGTSYQWYKDGIAITGAIQATFTATQAGTYTADIITNGCTGKSSNGSVVTLTATPTGSISPADVVLCSGSTATLTATGGTSYQWYKDGTPVANATAASLTVNEAGTYAADIFNATCRGKTSNEGVVKIDPLPSGTVTPANVVICSNGSAVLTVSGGTSYQWYRNGNVIAGATSASYPASQEGSYTADITNGTCTVKASNSSTVAIGTAPSGSISPSTATLCPSSSVVLTVSGGASYQWYRNGVALNGATANMFTATLEGTYSADIISGDCKGKASNEAIVTAGSSVTGIIAPATASICPGEKATLTASGGSTYQWYKDGVVIPGAVAATYTASQPGTYRADVFSGNCQGTTSNQAVVTQSAAPTGSITPASATLCANSSVTLTVSGGISYQWYKDGVPVDGATAADYSVSTSGTYSADIIASGGCKGKAGNDAVITVGNSLTGSITPSNSTVCPGGMVTLTITGGTSYQWYKNGLLISGATQSTLDVSEAGTYTADILSGACKGRAANEATVVIGSSITGTITPSSASLCSIGSAALRVSGGSSYQWYKDGVAITGATSASYVATSAGTYTADIFSGTCKGKAANEAVVTSGTVVPAAITPSAASICPGDAQLLTTSGGTSYQWSRNGIAIPGATAANYSATQAGIYTVTIFSGSCSSAASNEAVVSVSNTPQGAITPSAAAICSGGSTTLTASGGTSYQWYLNNTAIAGAISASFEAKQAGLYSVIISNGSCSSPAANTATVTLSNAPTGSITPAQVRICIGGAQLLTATGGSSYQWYKDGIAINGATAATYSATQAGIYSVIILNGNCSGMASNTATVTLSDLPGAMLTAAGPTRFCEGANVLLQVNSASTYQWYKDDRPIANAVQQTYTASQSGNYKVMVNNAANCSSMSNEISVTTIALPAGLLTASSTVICPGGAVNLLAAGGASYQWYLNGSAISGATTATLSATQAGVYRADIINADGCKGKASNEMVLTVAKKPVANFEVKTVCANQPANFINKTDTANSGAIEWLWNFGDNQTAQVFAPAHTYQQPGTFAVTLVARSGTCLQLTDTVRKEISINEVIPATRYFPVRTAKGKPYPLAARNIGRQYLWQPATDLDDAASRTPVITPTTERTYLINITTSNGCVTVDTLLVQVLNGTEVFVPKAFTPNRNGVNDVLRPIGVNIPQITYFRVYNRWGQLVFETSTVGEGWDGTFKGVAQPTDTYTWVFEGKDADGHLVKASGKSILIR